jgi:hypothetical protein
LFFLLILGELVMYPVFLVFLFCIGTVVDCACSRYIRF